MKTPVLTGLFIFSIMLNLAVAGTLLWHFWLHPPPPFPPTPVVKPGSDNAELELVRRKLAREWHRSMKENRQKIFEKHREILDLIAQDPGNPHAADKALAELSALRSEMERRAVSRLTKIIGELPEDKRATFISYLKERSRGGMGMGMGRGPRHPGRPDCGPPPMHRQFGPPPTPPE